MKARGKTNTLKTPTHEEKQKNAPWDAAANIHLIMSTFETHGFPG